MPRITVTHKYGNGSTETYSWTPCENNIEKRPLTLEEREKENKRLATVKTGTNFKQRANSVEYKYFSTFTNELLAMKPILFLDIVKEYLKIQGITEYIAVIEPAHPVDIRLEPIKNENIVKNVKRITCKKQENNSDEYILPTPEYGFHIHLLSTKKIDFTDWLKFHLSNPDDLYSEEIETSQQKCVEYMSKYIGITKQLLPKGTHIYKAKGKTCKRETYVERNNDDGSIDILFDNRRKETIEKLRTFRNLQRKLYREKAYNKFCIYRNLFKLLKENTTFHRMYRKKNSLRTFYLTYTDRFFHNIIDKELLNKQEISAILKCNFYLDIWYDYLLGKNYYPYPFQSYFPLFCYKVGYRTTKNPYFVVKQSEKTDKINVFMSNTKKYGFLIPQKNIKKQSDTGKYVLLIPLLIDNWLLKYVTLIKNMPDNHLTK